MFRNSFSLCSVQMGYELGHAEKRLQVEARDAHGRADHKNPRTFQEGVVTGAGP